MNSTPECIYADKSVFILKYFGKFDTQGKSRPVLFILKFQVLPGHRLPFAVPATHLHLPWRRAGLVYKQEEHDGENK